MCENQLFLCVIVLERIWKKVLEVNIDKGREYCLHIENKAA